MLLSSWWKILVSSQLKELELNFSLRYNQRNHFLRCKSKFFGSFVIHAVEILSTFVGIHSRFDVDLAGRFEEEDGSAQQ